MFVKFLGRWLLVGLLFSGGSTYGQSIKERVSESIGPAPSSAMEGTPDLARVTKQVLAATNQFRTKEGRGELKVNAELTRAAQYFADFMARTDQYSHTADGKEPWQRGAMYGYDYCVFLENIAWAYNSMGFTAEEMARTFMDGWEKSPPHRKNLLDPDVSEIGVGVARSNKTGKFYAVQDFGRPKSQEIVFRITNATDTAVPYTVDGQSRTIDPRYTITHSRCRPPDVRIPQARAAGKQPAGGAVLHPRSGAHYVIRQDSAGQFTVGEE